MFAPILKQAVPHPQHIWLLPTALTLAALGISQHQLTKFKHRLQPGYHWIEEIGGDRVRRHFYTRAGLLELCDLVCSDRTNQLHQAIVSQSNAIIPRPATTAIHESQWLPRQPEPPSYQEPGQLAAYHQSALEPAPVSGNLLSDPRLFELLQLKRDELEVQRSQLENERLRLIQTAYQQQQSAIPITTQQPQPPLQRELGAQAGQPIHINVKVENKSEGGYYWDTFGFIELVFMVCMVSLFAIGAFAAVVSLRPNHSSLSGMSRHV